MNKYLILIVLATLISLLILFIPSTSAYERVDPPERPDIKTYSAQKVQEVFGDNQWKYFNEIIERESHWNNLAQNPTSSAFGYAQSLNSSWRTVGCIRTSDKYIQRDCAIKYIELRYNNPQKAMHFCIIHKWY